MVTNEKIDANIRNVSAVRITVQKCLLILSIFSFKALACDGRNILDFNDPLASVEIALDRVQVEMENKSKNSDSTYFLVKKNGDIVWNGEAIGNVSASSRVFVPSALSIDDNSKDDHNKLINLIGFLARNCIPGAFKDKHLKQYLFEYGVVDSPSSYENLRYVIRASEFKVRADDQLETLKILDRRGELLLLQPLSSF